MVCMISEGKSGSGFEDNMDFVDNKEGPSDLEERRLAMSVLMRLRRCAMRCSKFVDMREVGGVVGW